MSVIHQPESASTGRLHEKLSAILQICRQMNAERDVGQLLDLVARESTLLLEADRASIFLLDQPRMELWSRVALGSDEILRFDARTGIAGSCALTGQTINVGDAYCDPRFNPAIDDQTGYRTCSILAVPLQELNGEIVGVFEVLNKMKGAFTAEDEQVLKQLAAQVAIAIQTAQSIGELARNHAELAQENRRLRREVEDKYAGHSILGSSPRIQNILRLVDRIRDSSVNVLISGESGTGKELAAKAIHYSSLRARRPFVALNCAALPEALVESELFGIERGVATGVQQRVGQFQAADGGTLFLDEIADLSLSAQAKILRVLQERIVERVGGRSPLKVDVRVLAASNKDLEAEIRKGSFREDLYYRLKVIRIHMPALREIREDIPLLANHFLTQCCREANKDLLEFGPGVLDRLRDASWPGNVRQLQNEFKRLVACARRRVITLDDLCETLCETPCETSPGSGPEPKENRPRTSLKSAIESLERQMIAETLQETGHNQQRTARALGLSRQGLINKINRYGLR